MRKNYALPYELIKAFMRLIFLIVSCLLFAALCAHCLENAPVWRLAEKMQRDASPIVTGLPTWVWMLLVPFRYGRYLRYAILPAGAFLLIFISSSFYVQDIYHLPHFSRAMRYVFASLFAIGYPMVRVESGRINDEDPDDESNLENLHLLRAIGGPGFVRIQPGNAVAFRDWRNVIGIQHDRLYFMRPFEMIARVVNLEDQHGHINEAPAVTRDGIRLRLKNIEYRFSVLHPEKKSRGQPRSQSQTLQREQNEPYPFSPSAIETIAYSFAVSDRGLETWHQTVERTVNSALGTFINDHDLDYLTAPRQDGQNPRRELRVELFAPAINTALRKAGAELHWMDIGHFAIDGLRDNVQQDPVDETRTKFWAARWVGDANTVRSYGEAKHMMYQELARAEAQAEMIMSITDALRDASFGPDRAETLRQIFLARTAQILEAMRDERRLEPPT